MILKSIYKDRLESLKKEYEGFLITSEQFVGEYEELTHLVDVHLKKIEEFTYNQDIEYQERYNMIEIETFKMEKIMNDSIKIYKKIEGESKKINNDITLFIDSCAESHRISREVVYEYVIDFLKNNNAQ